MGKKKIKSHKINFYDKEEMQELKKLYQMNNCSENDKDDNGKNGDYTYGERRTDKICEMADIKKD